MGSRSGLLLPVISTSKSNNFFGRANVSVYCIVTAFLSTKYRIGCIINVYVPVLSQSCEFFLSEKEYILYTQSLTDQNNKKFTTELSKIFLPRIKRCIRLYFETRISGVGKIWAKLCYPS